MDKDGDNDCGGVQSGSGSQAGHMSGKMANPKAPGHVQAAVDHAKASRNKPPVPPANQQGGTNARD